MYQQEHNQLGLHAEMKNYPEEEEKILSVLHRLTTCPKSHFNHCFWVKVRNNMLIYVLIRVFLYEQW